MLIENCHFGELNLAIHCQHKDFKIINSDVGFVNTAHHHILNFESCKLASLRVFNGNSGEEGFIKLKGTSNNVSDVAFPTNANNKIHSNVLI